MPSKQSGSSEKAAREPSAGPKSSASVRSRAPRALADAGGGIGGNGEGDPPIIVQGGGSISLDVPGKFKDEGSDGHGGRRFKNNDQDLTSLTVDGKDVPVTTKSRIMIRYGGPGKNTPKS